MGQIGGQMHGNLLLVPIVLVPILGHILTPTFGGQFWVQQWAPKLGQKWIQGGSQSGRRLSAKLVPPGERDPPPLRSKNAALVGFDGGPGVGSTVDFKLQQGRTCAAWTGKRKRAARGSHPWANRGRAGQDRREGKCQLTQVLVAQAQASGASTRARGRASARQIKGASQRFSSGTRWWTAREAGAGSPRARKRISRSEPA